MKTFFNRKSWLFTLSVAFFASSMSTAVLAQDNKTVETKGEFTIINTTSDENPSFFTKSNDGKDHSSYSITRTSKGNFFENNKPKLGVLLEGNESETVILKIFPNSTAAEAGLQKGDKILSLNGKKSENITGLINLIEEHQVGDQVTIQYERNGVLRTSNAAFKKASENHFQRKKHYNYSYNYDHNYKSEDLTENPCEKLQTIYGKPFLGVYLSTSRQEDGTGALLTSIIAGTGAYDASLKAADKITKMNNTSVASTKEAIAFIRSHKPGDDVRIELIRDNKPMVINAVLGSWADNPNTMRKVRILTENCTEKAPKEVIEETKDVATKEKETEATSTFKNQNIMEIFPNPTPDFVNIRFEGKKAPLAISIISLDGKEMFSKTIQNFNGNYNDQLDLSKYPSGIYLINLKQNDQQTTQQVVVE